VTRRAIETPVDHLKQCLSESAPNVAGAMRATRWLGPGTLTGGNAHLVERLRALGVEVPNVATVLPAPAIGAVQLLDSDGATNRALRVALRRHDRGGHPAWLDARSLEAWRIAREACRALLSDFEPPESADALEPADAEPDWTERIGAPIAGRSVALPLALATLSDWLAQPLPIDIAATGDLDVRGNVLAVDLVAEKATGLAIERPYVRTLIVPAASRIDRSRISPTLHIVPVRTLAEAASVAKLELAAPVRAPMRRENLVDAVRRFEDLATSRRIGVSRLLVRGESLWYAFARLEDDAATSDSDEALLTLVARLIEYRTTMMLCEEAIALHPVLDRVRRRRPWFAQMHARTVVRALNAYASALIDAPRLGDAESAAREALSLTAVGSSENLRVRGSIARVLSHRREDERAAEALVRIVEEQEREIPRESNLPRCYLIGALVRLGRLEQARDVLARGRSFQAQLAHSRGWGASNELFLDYEEIRLLTAERRPSQAVVLARQLLHKLDAEDIGAPWPKIGVVNRLVDALLADDRIDEAEEHLSRCRADVGPRRSRHMRWIFAQVEGALAAWYLHARRGDDARVHLDALRAACSEIPTTADAPYVSAARRIAAGEAGPEVIEELRRNEIY
jgi:hypothetical protein